ncbi:MAG: glucose-phosphate thymidylyltransferase [Gaiellaceae bacterium]|jgi:CTP:molybdopterin cytidylyltransferase MocA|nr:glucose-phosphate thymidylyltransferase [Gaiellaceae bacterium]
MAAGEGRRMRPLSERWPKPVLPIDGRPVIASLMRELAASGLSDVTVVTGHLAEQVEELVGDGSAFGVEVRYARQPSPDGSADAVRRAVEAGVRPPFLVSAADTLYTPGDVGRFAGAFIASGKPSALAYAPDGSPAPLWGLTAAVLLDGLAGPPFELLEAVQRAGEIARVEIGKTRAVTDPLDLARENFPYLR